MELESKAYGKGNDEGPVEGNKERKADYSGGDLRRVILVGGQPSAVQNQPRDSSVIFPPRCNQFGDRRGNHANRLTGD